MTQAGRQSAPSGAPQPFGAAGAQPRTFGMGDAAAQVPPVGAGAPARAYPLASDGTTVYLPPYSDAQVAFPPGYAPGAYETVGAPQPYAPAVSQMPYPYPYAGQQPAAPAPQKKKRRVMRWLLLLLLLLCIAAAVAFLLFDCGSNGSKRAGIAGQLDGKTPDEIQAELDRIVDEGMFNISIASTVQMANGVDPAELRIENVPGNRYLMRVVLVRDDTGEQLYETDLIEPNFHIQQDTLDVVLPAGIYPCTALFYAYDQETEEQVGQAAARITVNVAS